MKLRHYQYAFLAILTLLVGCQTLGVPQPQSFNDRVAAGYITVDGIAAGTLLLGQAGKITPADAQNIHDQDLNLKVGLDIARTLHATQPQAAEDRLSATLAGLMALDAYLKTRGQ